MHKTLGLSITRIEALGWKIAKRAAVQGRRISGCTDKSMAMSTAAKMM
jgi:hypothetical protein